MSVVAVPHIGVQAIRPLFDALRMRGIDERVLLTEVGLAGMPLTDLNARLPLIYLDRILECAAVVLGDANLGLHLAETVEPDSFGLISYLGMASASWGEGLQRVLRYFRLLSEGSRYDLHVSDGLAILTATQDTPPGEPVRQRVEFTVSVIFCYGRRAIDGDWQALDVFFEHAPPPDIAEHRRVYGRAPRFAAPQSGFSFAADLLVRPLRTRDPALAKLLEHLAALLLADLPHTTTVAATVRDLCIRHRFEGELTLEAAARQLRLSPRTLQRRLREEGTSHHEVVDSARQHLATRMLAQPALGIAEVAFALGFSEPGALHRAFKRWTGMTPAEYRRAGRSS